MKINWFWRKSVQKSTARFHAREKKAISSIPHESFDASLEKNVAEITKQLGKNMDFVISRMVYAGLPVVLCFFQSLVDTKKLSENVVLPLQNNGMGGAVTRKDAAIVDGEVRDLLDEMKQRIVLSDVQVMTDWQNAINELLLGKALLLAEGQTAGLLVGAGKVEKRDISAPETEQSVVGPRESFVEDLGTNLTLIRQRLRDPFLLVESVQLARRGMQGVAVLYLADVANPSIVKEVKRRLDSIVTDTIRGQMHLQEMLEDNPLSLFPQLRPTERPDVICSYLLEGNVAVIVDGAAHALILPITFFQLLDTVDDYYSGWQYATLIRFVRMLALSFSIVVPGLYVSLVAYNPELIPTRLVISMDAARVKVAMPIILEIFAMDLMMEILREAGIKLPRPIGQAISIIGGLVIGEAAVNANLVSPVTVVIVAVTAISSFTAPVYLLGITYRILRFFLLVCGSVLGLYGLLLGLFLIHAHAARLVSFGVPYLAPLSPLRIKDWSDTLIRLSFRKLTDRPSFLRPLQRTKAVSMSMNVHKRRKN
jgi:hypothetical protein